MPEEGGDVGKVANLFVVGAWLVYAGWVDRLECDNHDRGATYPVSLPGKEAPCLHQDLVVDLRLGGTEKVGGIGVRLVILLVLRSCGSCSGANGIAGCWKVGYYA